MNSKLWKQLNTGNPIKDIKKRAGVTTKGMPLDTLVRLISEGKLLIINKNNPVLPMKIPLEYKNLHVHTWYEKVRHMADDELRAFKRRGQITIEDFQKYGNQFDVEVLTREEASLQQKGPQRLMVEAIERADLENLTLNRDYNMIANRGFEYEKNPGEHMILHIEKLFQGWIMTAALLLDKSHSVWYSNPPTGFWIDLPSRSQEYDPDDAQNKIVLMNLATSRNMNENYAKWHKFSIGTNTTNIRRQSTKRYLTPETSIDHRIITSMGARSAFSDNVRDDYGFNPPATEFALPPVRLNLALVPSREMLSFYLNLQNNVLIEYKGDLVKPKDSHQAVLLSYFRHQLHQNTGNIGFHVDENLRSLPDIINYIDSQQKSYI